MLSSFMLRTLPSGAANGRFARSSRLRLGRFAPEARTFASSSSSDNDPVSAWRTPEHAYPAEHFKRLGIKNAVECQLCPRHCKILPNRFGFCGVRGNVNGELVTYNFGRSVQAALETIETEAVYHYSPGASIMSLGNIGCMMSCTFCHNWQTSQVKHLSDKSVYYYTPEEVVETALENNIDILSWTYNDPVVWHEFVCKTAELGQKHGIKSLYKSAFYIEEEPIKELCDVIDIFSLSLKSMDDTFYRKVCNGRLAPVLRGIEQVYKAGKHLEVSQLLVTNQNDSEDQCRATAQWHAQSLSSNVPLHFVRFHPAFKYTAVGRTPLDRLYRARDIAHEEGLSHVYIGNVYEPGCADTKCHSCGHIQVKRFGLTTEVTGIDQETNRCLNCGSPSSIKDPFGGTKFVLESASSSSSRRRDGEVEHLIRETFGDPPEKLVTLEVSWSEEVNSVHVVFSDATRTEQSRLVVIREPQEEPSMVSNSLGRIILSRSSAEESGIRVFSDCKFELYSVLDRAHFPVLPNEKDGEGPTTPKSRKDGEPKFLRSGGLASSSIMSSAPATNPSPTSKTSRKFSSVSEAHGSAPIDHPERRDEGLALGTLLVRSKPDFAEAKPVTSPIFQTSAFESGDPYFYSRASNPNFEDVEQLFTEMDEGATGSVLLSSGMAAIAGVLASLKPGNRVVANTLNYGCSTRFLKDYCSHNQIGLDFVDLWCETSRGKRLEASKPDLVFFETPTNPFLRTVPISSVAAEAKTYNPGCTVVVDNTWATPIFQRPLELGADVAIYSCSKFFSGHSDTILGVASCKNETEIEQFRAQRFYHGAVPDPFAAWLLRRSLQTLKIRMESHMASTAKIATHLRDACCSHNVEEVFMPTVDGEQLSGYGGLLFFKMKDDMDGIKADLFADSLSLFDRGTPMATVRSAVAIPYTGSHASMTAKEKADIGLGKDIVRLSIGLEDPVDLAADLENAFRATN